MFWSKSAPLENCSLFHVFSCFMFFSSRFDVFSCWFHVGFIVAIVFLKNPRGNVYFWTSVSYVLMFFHIVIMIFEFEWFVDVFFMCLGRFFAAGRCPGSGFPQEYECFGQNPAPLKNARFSCFFHVIFMIFHVFFMFFSCLFIMFSCWFHRRDRFCLKSSGNVYFLMPVSYVLLFFQFCLHGFGHLFSDFFKYFSCFFHVSGVFFRCPGMPG